MSLSDAIVASIDSPLLRGVRSLTLSLNRSSALRRGHLLEVIPEEVKTSGSGRIHQAGLVGMKRQSVVRHPRLHAGQRGFRLFLASAQQDEVVGIAHHLHAGCGHQMIQWIEVDVRQQGADDRPLWRTSFRGLVQR